MAEFHNWGYWGLYDIQTVEEIKARKGMSENDNLLDNIGAVELGANLFRITQTDYKIKNEEINTQQKVNQAHRKVGMNVRNAIMANNGELPENLPKEEPIKEVEKRLKVKQNHADELELF